MEQIENGVFPPKPPDSVERRKEAVTKTSGLFAPKVVARKLDFTKSGSSLATSSSLEEDPKILAKPTISVPRLFPSINLESLRYQPQANIKANNGTTKHIKVKQCRCKQSKCLKLYCECFACGLFCDGCNCTDCHNNAENEAARQAAVGCVLVRNPNAFRPKIANSPLGIPDKGDEAYDIPVVEKYKKGCQCKKTWCIKKYCECFQANILCSENCKCVDCKNCEGNEEMLAVFHLNDCNTKTSIHQDNAVIASGIDFLGNRFSLASGKRKGLDLLDSNEKNSQIQRLPQHQQLANPLRASGPFSAMSVDPVRQGVGSAVLQSSKLAYSASYGTRSLLADVIHLEDIRKLCADLVIASEISIKVADKNGAADKQEARYNDDASLLADRDKNCPREPDIQKVPDDHLSGNGDDAISTNDAASGNADSKEGKSLPPGVYMEQERLVLSEFRNRLKKLIADGNIKGSITLPDNC